MASLATAGDCDLLWPADDTKVTALTLVTAPQTWVIDSEASHYLCNDRTSFRTFKKLPTPMIIELADNKTVMATQHGVVKVQSYQIDVLYTFMFPLSHLSTSQLWWNPIWEKEQMYWIFYCTKRRKSSWLIYGGKAHLTQRRECYPM
jgi:hypothetical protein